MKVPFFLTVNSNGSIRSTKNRPDLAWNEVSIACTLVVPDALFRKPALSATITVPDDAATPNEIPTDIQMNVKDAIEAATGLEVRLTVEPHEQQETTT